MLVVVTKHTNEKSLLLLLGKDGRNIERKMKKKRGMKRKRKEWKIWQEKKWLRFQ